MENTKSEYDEFRRDTHTVIIRTYTDSSASKSEFFCEYDEHGNLKDWFYGSSHTRYAYEYDERGRKTRVEKYVVTGDAVLDAQPVSVETYQYDGDRLIGASEDIHPNEAGDWGEMRSRCSYLYDADGGYTFTMYWNDMPDRTECYDKDENLLWVKLYRPDGTTYFTKKCDFNERGRLVCETNYREDGNIENKELTEYNDAGYPSMTQMLDEYGAQDSFCRMYYDKLGNMVRRETGYRSGDGLAVTTYEYDSAGNVIKEVLYSPQKDGTEYVSTITSEYVPFDIPVSLLTEAEKTALENQKKKNKY